MGVDSRIAPGGPRLLTQRNLEKRVLEANGVEVPRPSVDPGNMQLFSFYKPGLTAGNYFIRAEQYIATMKDTPFQQTLRVWNWKEKAEHPQGDGSDVNKTQPPVGKQSEPQEFEVMAPQFNLDPKLVNSFYPPEGHQDEGRILPHIVISDPHFPWERDAGHSFDGTKDDPLSEARERDPDINKNGQYIDADGNPTDSRHKMVYRSIIPWIKLVVFDPEEIQITSLAEAEKLGIPEYQPSKDPTQPDLRDISKQQADYAFTMTAGEYLNQIPVNSRVDFEQGYANDGPGLKEIKSGRRSKEAAKVVFPTKDLFFKLFGGVDGIESNKYLAHVRNVNTIGFPNAGLEEDGLFSIVISGRTGALHLDKPKTQIVHLVSMEHIDATLESDFEDWSSVSVQKGKERIGLISLFSWTYTALPPDPFNFVETMRKIVGDADTKLRGNMQMLRPPDDLLTKMELELTNQTTGPKPNPKSRHALIQRLKYGYTLSRWRAETGEVTAAFGRGPLVPIQTKSIPCTDWPTGSNHSKNYQIFDKSTGLMDLSYSSAWQLGKMLAIADTSFNGALMRFRSFIQRGSEDKTRKEADGVPTREEIVSNVKAAVADMQKVISNTTARPQRIIQPNKTHLASRLTTPHVAALLGKNIVKAVEEAGSADEEPFYEFNPSGANNTDWTVIHQWITDKLYLGGIPAHVLFPDPSFIPEESIRFFYIDDAWLDCLIDGALSVGNHLEKDDDRIKNAIKEWYNVYLRHEVPSTKLRPQIPCYGFILRSQLVKCMPDMKIKINWNKKKKPDGKDDETDQRAEVCQWLRPDDHTLICLLDRYPEEMRGKNSKDPDQGGIVLSQPPHQQRFSFGQGLTNDKTGFLFELRQLYTQGDLDLEWPLKKNVQTGAEGCIDLSTRLIEVTKLAKLINKNIQLSLPTPPEPTSRAYIDYVPNSAEFALELNDPAYYFSVYPEYTSTDVDVRDRQLWTRKVQSKTVEPKTEPIIPDFAEGLGESTDVPIPQPAPQPSNDINKIPYWPPDRQVPPLIIRDLPAMDILPGSQQARCFTLQVFPDYKTTSPPRTRLADDPIIPKDDYIPTMSSELFDLIFVITKFKDKTKNNNQMLKEVVVNIPIVPIRTGNHPTDALLSPNWDGNIHMLGNQRFFPFVNRSKNIIQIRIVPRSAQQHPVIKMNDLRTKELSFRLTYADIPKSDVRRKIQFEHNKYFAKHLGYARIDMFERYEDGNVWNDPGFIIVKRDADEPIKA